MNTFSLSKAETPLKVVATLFLCGLGISYFFGLLMVMTWTGLTPRALQQSYQEKSIVSGSATTSTATDAPINLNQNINVPHKIDRDLLVQDTHVHLPVYTVIATLLSVITLGLNLQKRAKIWLIIALFLGGWLDFIGMWGLKFVASFFAYVTLAGGWLMFASWLVVTVMALAQMWHRTGSNTT